MTRRLLMLLALMLLCFSGRALADQYALTEAERSIDAGKSFNIYVTLAEKQIPASRFTWTTSDKTVAVISSRGKVSAKSAGEAVITAAAPDGQVLACHLTVTQPVTRLKASSRLTLDVGQTSVFSVVVQPADATDQTLTYASSNEMVAQIDAQGRILPLKAGKTTLTARSTNGKSVSMRLTVTQPVTEVILNPPQTRLDAGRSMTLRAQVLPADATVQKVTYTSSDPQIATVSSSGKVRGKKAGEVVITATAASGVSASCRMAIEQPVQSVKAAQSALATEVGSKQTVVFTVLPADATTKTLSYASSNPSVFSVDAQTGEMTAHRAGSAYLTAAAVNGKSARVRVTVIQPVLSLSITDQSLVIENGKRVSLKTTILPQDATDKKLTFSSSDKTVATVSYRGEISARKAGQAIITATSSNGLTASVHVTVTQPVTRVKFSFTRKTINKYETVLLPPSLSPANATDQSLFWRSSDPTIASVSPDGEITGLRAGSVTITAQAASGKTARFQLIVKEIPLTGLRIERPYLSLMPGQNAPMNVQVQPENASEQRIFYESSHPDVASVDENGFVTALSMGTAIITARSSGDRVYERTCRVEVAAQPVKRLEGRVIGINPGHQTRSNAYPIPIAPGSREKVYSIKVGSAGVVTRVPEYEVNLQVALRLKTLLEAEGATVIMTRTHNDVNLSNIERANLMNEAGCDLALQIHCNGSRYKSLKGFSTYAKRTGVGSVASQQYAALMLDSALAVCGADNAGCGASDGYASLNWSTVPSVLLEMGYMSNADEDRLLASASYQALLAQAICEGVCACFYPAE